MRTTTKNPVRPINVIAEEIIMLWNKPSMHAVPYLDAMRRLDNITNTYGLDPADEIIMYFLSNATSWRGPDARRIKKELNDMLK